MLVRRARGVRLSGPVRPYSRGPALGPVGLHGRVSHILHTRAQALDRGRERLGHLLALCAGGAAPRCRSGRLAPGQRSVAGEPLRHGP